MKRRLTLAKHLLESTSMGMQELRAMAACRTLIGLTTSPEGRDGMLRGLEQALKTSGALRAQFATLLAKQIPQAHSGGGATPRRISQSKTMPFNQASVLNLVNSSAEISG